MVHVAVEAAGGDDRLEVGGEVVEVGVGQHVGEALLVRLGERTESGEEIFTSGGQRELVCASIGGTAAPFEAAIRFESIEHRHHATRAYAELFTGGLLADAGGAADETEQSRFGRGDAQLADRLLERGRGLGPDLSEEERDAAAGSTSAHALHDSSLDKLFTSCTITSMTDSSRAALPPVHHPPPATHGPNPGFLALTSLGLLVGSLVSLAVLSGGGGIRSPFGDTAEVTAVFAEHGFAVRFAAMLQLGSAIPLGIYSATVYARQQRLSIRVPGPNIGLFGGTAAAIFLAVSAVITWTQSQPAVSAQPELTHALAYLSFAVGGFAHVLGLGLLVAGIAVPALILRLLPMPLAWIGLVIAVIAELSFLSMFIDPLHILIPIGRFGSLIWLVIAGFLLPRTRHTREERA